MSTKIKIIFILILFLVVLFFSLKAESAPGLADNQKMFERVIKKVFPSVVKVEARNRTKKVATGVVIHRGGYIVTTALVSPSEEEISVITSEGKRIEAKFLGMDSVTHLALIQAKEKDLPPIKMGKMKELSPGTWIGVVTISPEDRPAVTQGIISSISQDKLRLNVWVLPGSSGSPVVDKQGNMVGLLRGIYGEDMPVFFEFREKKLVGSGYVFSRAEAPSSGMALAVPVSIVKEICDEIKEKGKVERGWLGVSIVDNDKGMVEIVGIEKDSPAEIAELKKGDIIIEFEGKEVTSTQMLASEIRKRKPGDSASLKIERNGKTKNIKVRLGEYSKKEIKRELELKFPRLFPPKPPKSVKPPEHEIIKIFPPLWESRKYIGVYLEELNRELSEYFGVREGEGLLVSKVTKESPAEKAGLKVGDVIIKADGERVDSVRELSELIQDKEKGEKIEIEFLRDRKRRTVEVEIEEEKENRHFNFSRGWEDYVDSWDKYRENLKSQYKNLKNYYQEDLKKNMQKLNRELEKIYREGVARNKEAIKKLEETLKRFKAARV